MLSWKKLIGYVLLVTIIVGFVWNLLAALAVPPDMLTKTRMIGIQVRIENYYTANQKLPDKLEQLPERVGYDNELIDGWGEQIQYIIKDNSVTLRSFGKDGKPGGIEAAEDILHTFLIDKLPPKTSS